MIVIAQKLSKLLLLTTASVIVNSMVTQKIYAQTVDLNNLCQKHPLSSSCAGYTYPLQTTNDSKLAANKTRKTIKMRLKNPGSDNEWLRIEIDGNTVKPIHTIRTNRNFTGLVNSALGAVSPVPLPSVRFDKWLDAPTTRVVFQPDSCSISPPPQVPENPSPQENQQVSSPPQPGENSTASVNQSPPPQSAQDLTASVNQSPPPQSAQNIPFQANQKNCLPSCAIEGTDSVVLPEGTDIRKGRFTIEYTEGDLLRTITFRIRDEDS